MPTSSGRVRTVRNAALLLALLLAATVATANQDFRVLTARPRLLDDTWVLDARIDYAFSPPVLEALDHGVPLTLLVQIQVRRQGAWVWEDSLADLRLRYRIRYQPLSATYVVVRLPSDSGRVYLTRETAIAALGDLENLPLLERQRLDPDARYEVHLRALLDIEELPLPLRPTAYLHPSWKQASEWTKWPLAQP